MPHLTLPAPAFRESYLAAAEEFAAEGRVMFRGLGIASEAPDAFERVLARLAEAREGRIKAEGVVPATDFWLVEGIEFLGQVSIRHTLNPQIERIGGHIGYAIRPSARRRGYGRLILRLALPEAFRLGINPALVTCDATNVASRKIIEANGGWLQDQVDQGEGLPPVMRFWVPTG
jgi:predicted acetyltransferase